jgi:hypothetical protein
MSCRQHVRHRRRGGRLLEHLVGCDIHSAERVVPEWQDVGVGDEVRLQPEVRHEVAALEPGRALVVL